MAQAQTLAHLIQICLRAGARRAKSCDTQRSSSVCSLPIRFKRAEPAAAKGLPKPGWPEDKVAPQPGSSLMLAR